MPSLDSCSELRAKMDLSSAFTAPSITKQQHKQNLLQSRFHFPKTNVNKKMQSFVPGKINRMRVVCCSSSQLKVEQEQENTRSNGYEEEETCELVNGTELTIAEDIRAYLFTAVKNNNETGILLLSDIFGFEDSSTRDFAYRLACNGYNVLVPDLFNGDPWAKDRPIGLLEQWITKHGSKSKAKIIFESAQWMINEFKAMGISNKLGIIGFCYGGGRVIDILSQDQDAYFGSGVSFYGTRIDSSCASNITVPLLLITGDSDALCPISILQDITENINKEFTKMVVFEGREHGFAHRPRTPEEDADAEEAFIMMRNWLHHGLLA